MLGTRSEGGRAAALLVLREPRVRAAPRDCFWVTTTHSYPFSASRSSTILPGRQFNRFNPRNISRTLSEQSRTQTNDSSAGFVPEALRDREHAKAGSQLIYIRRKRSGQPQPPARRP